MSSYITTIDTFSLSCTVFEIFDFKVSEVWPWPLTFKGNTRSNIFLPFASSYMIFYLTSVDTFSLSRTVFKIFDFKVFGAWPWLLIFRGHPRSKIVLLFESPYMTSYLFSVHIFFLSRTVFEIFDLKVFGVWPWPSTYRGHLGVKNIFNIWKSIHDFLSNFLSMSYRFRDIRLQKFRGLTLTFYLQRSTELERPCWKCRLTFSLRQTRAWSLSWPC